MQLDYFANNNAWTQKNPYAKSLLALGMLVLSLMSERVWVRGLVILSAAVIAVGLARIPLRYYMKLLRIPAFFLVWGLLLVLISIGGDNASYLASIRIGAVVAGVTQQGLRMAPEVGMRALACLSATMLFVLTVPLHQMVPMLRRLRVPVLFLELMLLIYRFVQIFLTEWNTMERALMLRGGDLSWRARLKSASYQASGMFVRMMNSMKRMNQSLELKGYDGNFYF